MSSCNYSLHTLNTKWNILHSTERQVHNSSVLDAPPVHQVVVNFALLNTRWVTGSCKVSYHPSCIINWLILNQHNTLDNLCMLQQANYSWYDTTAKAFKRPIHYFTQNVFSSFLEIEVKRGDLMSPMKHISKRINFAFRILALAFPCCLFLFFYGGVGEG